MKYISIFILLLSFSCKPTIKKEKTTTKISIQKKKKEIKKKSYREVKEFIAVLKNPKNLIEAKTIISNNGFTFKKLLFNKKTLKILLLEIPIEKQEIQKEKLLKSNAFNLVTNFDDKTSKNLINKFNNTLIKLNKTACSGECPVFSILINKQGKIYYNGLEGVLVKGKKEFQLTKKQLNILQDKLSKTTFNNYNSVYDTDIIDLPKTYIIFNDKEILIKIWKNVPDELIFVTEYIDDILLANKLFE